MYYQIAYNNIIRTECSYTNFSLDRESTPANENKPSDGNKVIPVVIDQIDDPNFDENGRKCTPANGRKSSGHPPADCLREKSKKKRTMSIGSSSDDDGNNPDDPTDPDYVEYEQHKPKGQSNSTY